MPKLCLKTVWSMQLQSKRKKCVENTGKDIAVLKRLKNSKVLVCLVLFHILHLAIRDVISML